ncbi:MAG: hypothetical protein Q8L55_13590 [Phycisphaerales bacterium]|nr:hypothetical protein [Phycisphaerales bacterium]
MVTTILVCAAVLAGPLEGQRVTPAHVVVLDRSLRSTAGELVSLAQGAAVLKLQDGEVTVEQPVAIVRSSMWGPERSWPGLPPAPPQDGAAVGAGAEGSGVWLDLTDGSRLRGDLLAAKADGLMLVHKRIGRVEFSLDSLASLSTATDGRLAEGAPSLSARPAGDTLLLANGDRLDGFIESIATPKQLRKGDGLEVTIERAGDKARVVVPIDRIARVTLSSSAPRMPGPLVWLRSGDGSAADERTAAAEFTLERGAAGSAVREARLVRAKGALPARIDVALLQGATLAGWSEAAMPLASCASDGGTMDPIQGGDQPLGTRDLTIAEPGEVRWRLPAGATRITGWVVLPEECRRWGDCTVTVSTIGKQPAAPRPVTAFTLNSATPVAALDATLATDGSDQVWLSVRVGEGKNGPTQDTVVLRHVLVGLGGAAK